MVTHPHASPDQSNAPDAHRARGEIDEGRRGVLRAAGALAAGLSGGLMTIGGARAAESATSAAAGTVRIDRSCRVDAGRLDALVSAAFPLFNQSDVLPPFDASEHGARHDVDLHRLVTTTTVPETGETLTVSGLLALPVGADGPLPVLSWQHGTILTYDQVPSNLVALADPTYELTDAKDSLETLFQLQRFAARGYAVIAADYVGKGPFRAGHSEGYAVKGVTVQTCLDILDAGIAAMAQLGTQPSALFLNGWSQGAVNTQWLHQELRRRSRPIAGTAVESPFNDLDEAWRYWAGQVAFPLPAGMTSYPPLPDWIALCMIITLGSYQDMYGIDGLLQSAIRPEYSEQALQFWSGQKIDPDAAVPLPTGSTLLIEDFFERFTDERNSAFVWQVAKNYATYYKYDAPIQFYFGLADEAIHPAMVQRALVAGGAFAVGVPIPRASHRATFLASLYGGTETLGGANNIVDWFDSIGR